jgi:hypothetical protein
MSERNTETRFWTLTERVGPCLIWKSTLDRNGYGRFTWDHRQRFAHRLAWLFSRGPIPNGMHVLHTCDNPPCVEPLHLFLGTQQDNMRDMLAKGRNFRPVGESHPRARLTAVQVAEIRQRVAAGANQTALALEYGVTSVNINRIVHHVIWRSVT